MNPTKPQFDPTKPFEVVGEAPKPKFDPSQPFEVVQPDEEGLDGSKVAKFAGGAALGVMEGLNPLAIPHGLEVLGRALTTESGGPLARLESASKNAYLPAMRLQDVGRDIRASGRILKGAAGSILSGEMPNVSELQKIQGEEQANQDAFRNLPYVKGGADAGELGVGIYSLGSLAKNAVTAATSLPEKIKSLANLKSYDSLKPLGKLADRIVDQDRVGEIGAQLRKDGINTVGATFKDILSRTEAKLSEYGKQIGNIVKGADEAVAKNPNLRGVPVGDIASEVELKVIAPLLSDPSTIPVAKSVGNWVDDLRAVTNKKDLTFKQAQDFKKNLEAAKAKFQIGGDSLAKEAFQDVYSILNRRIESAIGAIDPNSEKAFLDAKNSYRNLSDAQQLISKTVSRTSKNRGFSFSDYKMGTGGGVTGAIVGSTKGETPEDRMKNALLGAMGGATLSIVNRVARNRGNQVAAGALDTLAEFIKRDPNPVKTYQFLTGTGALNFMNKLGEE